MKCETRRPNTFVVAKLFLFVFAASLSLAVSAQNISVSGVIKDASGAAVPGAAVKVKDSKAGANTDSLGNFSLSVKAGATLNITAIGFSDTSVTVGSGGALSVVLRPLPNNLQNVTVNSTNNTSSVVDPIAFDQIMASTLSNFTAAASFSSGVTQVSGVFGRTPFHDITEGMGALNTVNSGEMLPQYMPKGETRGSRYLINGYVGGVVIDSSNGLIKNDAPIYNYDKIDGALLIRKDAQNNIEVDKAQVKGFAFKNGDATYVFMKVPALSANQYYLFVGAGSKYAIFKSLKTKFVKSNYVSNGLTESGNNYDEFVDQSDYYLLSLTEKSPTPVPIDLKKKSLKQAMAADGPAVDAYFKQHRDDDVNDAFVKGLVESLK